MFLIDMKDLFMNCIREKLFSLSHTERNINFKILNNLQTLTHRSDSLLIT